MATKFSSNRFQVYRNRVATHATIAEISINGSEEILLSLDLFVPLVVSSSRVKTLGYTAIVELFIWYVHTTVRIHWWDRAAVDVGSNDW